MSETNTEVEPETPEIYYFIEKATKLIHEVKFCTDGTPDYFVLTRPMWSEKPIPVQLIEREQFEREYEQYLGGSQYLFEDA